MADQDDSVEWRAIPGWPDYQVSSDGRVRRVVAPRSGPGCRRTVPYEMAIIIEPERGRRFVSLAKVGNAAGQQRILVSRLVAMAFHGPQPSPKHVACHENGDHTDNRASNLRWDTQKANIADKRRHGTHIEGVKSHMAKLTEDDVRAIRAARAAGETLKKIAARYGVHFSLIQYIEQRKVWAHVE